MNDRALQQNLGLSTMLNDCAIWLRDVHVHVSALRWRAKARLSPLCGGRNHPVFFFLITFSFKFCSQFDLFQGSYKIHVSSKFCISWIECELSVHRLWIFCLTWKFIHTNIFLRHKFPKLQYKRSDWISTCNRTKACLDCTMIIGYTGHHFA